MKQIILRIRDDRDDVEILSRTNDKEMFSAISRKKCLEILKHNFDSGSIYDNQKYIFYNDVIIGSSSNSIVLKQKEHKRIVTYEDKGYKIVFPNSIYIIYHNQNKIDDIEAYSYKEYKGLATELYRYPMPNMLSGNKICIGSAKREIIDDNYLASLENVLFAEFTHSTFDDLKSFKNTIEYFEYLSTNEFPYHLMIPINKTLGSILKL